MKSKKVVSGLLSALMLSTNLMVNIAYADVSETKQWGDNASYVIDYDTATVTITGKGKLKNTDTAGNYDSPFKGDTFIEKVVIGEGITSICNNAFNGCANLKEVDLPESLEFIGKTAFTGTELYNSQIKENSNELIMVDNWIVDYSKKGEDVSELIIPDGCVGIGTESFKKLIVNYSLVYRLKNTEKIVFPNTLRYINYGAFSEAEMKLKSLELPTENDLYIDSYAFSNAFSDNITDTVNELDIDIPRNVKGIGAFAFSGNKRLYDVTLNDGLITLSNNAFDGCTLSDPVVIPDTLERLGAKVFINTPFEKEFDSSTEKALYLGNWLYKINGNNPSYIDIREGTLGIADSPGIPVTAEFKLPSTLKYIGSSAFAGQKKKEIVLPKSLEAIYSNAFEKAELKTVNFPKSLKYIGSKAFLGCRGLTKVVIPENVEFIGDGAFSGLIDTNNGTSVVVYSKDCIIEQIEYVNVYAINYALDFNYIIGYKGSTAEAYSDKYAQISHPYMQNDVYWRVFKPLIIGDVNADGIINITDITKVAAHVKGKKLLDENAQKFADVNNDGKINISDITKIAAHVKGKKLLS
ncbi:leucine-rich repeat protein [Ruminococcus albus]|uniref:Leucine rich repeat-containing protein n=1 Tax=Ruminococcus albus TaxID=1264 RepID=A0A1H7PKS0_RUMAL|nr:leucine-rich repeat protein [Ruminococcus albus]SEL36078.1 Leucine rich repeat-containing protein [Ruminococcus albus]